MRPQSLSLLMIAASVPACNDHPLTPLDVAVSATQTQVEVQPERAQIDLLFVIDDSGSMCEEQANLARNFRAFSDFLFDDLGPAADFRVAVTSTDLVADRGRFLAEPALAVPARDCLDATTGAAVAPDTADCFDGTLDPIIRSGPGLTKAELARHFRCLATLGTNGDSQEKGLEAMRLALSCAGPNADRFGECCVDGAYDPGCAPAVEPDFLRPEARLVVVFVSDEDDCSDPAENPAASSRAICKYGPADRDGDGVPDGYLDATLCDGAAPRACFARECGDADAEACHARCAVARDTNACEWDRDRLVPPAEYVAFLHGLKAEPLQQVLVASIVGGQVRTPTGTPVTYNPGEPTAACAAEDALAPSEACCPEGRCLGAKRPACESANGQAFAGRRYLALTQAFGRNGIGCRPEDEGTAACVDICTDDFAGPLARIKDGLIDLVGLRCLDKPPACTVVTAEGARACAGDQLADPANYEVYVHLACGADPAACEQFDANPEAWRLVPSDEGCAGGAAVRLGVTPPPGAELVIDYRVRI